MIKRLYYTGYSAFLCHFIYSNQNKQPSRKVYVPIYVTAPIAAIGWPVLYPYYLFDDQNKINKELY